MADMLAMTAFQQRRPIAYVIELKADNLALHNFY